MAYVAQQINKFNRFCHANNLSLKLQNLAAKNNYGVPQGLTDYDLILNAHIGSTLRSQRKVEYYLSTYSGAGMGGSCPFIFCQRGQGGSTALYIPVR